MALMDGTPPSPTGSPPVGTAPMAARSSSPGAAASAMAVVRSAIQMLQKALPDLPIGSPVHGKIAKVITDLSKEVPATAEVPGVQATALRDLGQQAQQSQALQSVQRMMGAGGQPPGPGGLPGQDDSAGAM